MAPYTNYSLLLLLPSGAPLNMNRGGTIDAFSFVRQNSQPGRT